MGPTYELGLVHELDQAYEALTPLHAIPSLGWSGIHTACWSGHCMQCSLGLIWDKVPHEAHIPEQALWVLDLTFRGAGEGLQNSRVHVAQIPGWPVVGEGGGTLAWNMDLRTARVLIACNAHPRLYV